MPQDPGKSRSTHDQQSLGGPPSGIFAKLLTAVASVVVLVVAFTISLLFFAFVAAAAMVIGSYLWWKTRDLRKRMRERPPGGRIIEGEVIRDAGPPQADRR